MTSLTSFSHGGATAQKVIQLDSNGNYHNWDVPGWSWNGQGWAGMAGSVMEWEIEAGTGGNAGQFRLTHTDPGNVHSHNGSTAWVSPDSSTGIVTLPMNVLFNSHALAALFCKPPAAAPVTNSTNTPTINSTSSLIHIYRDLLSTDKVIAFIGGGNPSQGQLYISDSTGPRTVGVAHVFGTDTTIEWSPISTGTYDFEIATGTGYNSLASVTVDMSATWPPIYAPKKKVSCNFW